MDGHEGLAKFFKVANEKQSKRLDPQRPYFNREGVYWEETPGFQQNSCWGILHYGKGGNAGAGIMQNDFILLLLWL